MSDPLDRALQAIQQAREHLSVDYSSELSELSQAYINEHQKKRITLAQHYAAWGLDVPDHLHARAGDWHTEEA